ncbi:hypothetical protein [Actinoplanes sp. G11-F43]|uniref:hypothetical protein n=1 Tax=Actinoplanes sp. G11-F43 TaxID=3424130 RepID=UPI003D358781
MQDEQAAWREEQRRAVAVRAAALEADRAAEARKAEAMLDDFVRRAAEAGIRARVLTARSLDGRSTYKTHIRGWYLKSDRSVAVGEDGEFYVLTVAPSLRARFAGADLSPSVARLVIGAGGRDGESIPLPTLLEQRLAAGEHWP